MSDPVNSMRKTTRINDIWENNLHSYGSLLTVIGDVVLPSTNCYQLPSVIWRAAEDGLAVAECASPLSVTYLSTTASASPCPVVPSNIGAT